MFTNLMTCKLSSKKMKLYSFSFVIITTIVVLLSVFIVLSQEVSPNRNTTEKIKLVIDVDAGIDDAIAILYLLRMEKYLQQQNDTTEFEILGITCVNGNTLLDNVLVNVLKTLRVVNRLDIPVYRGASQSLLTTPPDTEYFGKDGFGDVPDDDPPSISLVQSEHAVNALIRHVNENQGEITILSLAPLTNIALAIRLDENFLKKVKNIVILGGCVEGQGNVFPGVEFNFFVDPEAVQIVLNSTEVDSGVITLFPWEVVLKATIPRSWRMNELRVLTSPEILFLNELESSWNHTEDEQWIMADPMAAMMVLHKELITKSGTYGIVTVLNGLTRGGIAVDYGNFLNSHNRIDIVLDIDLELYKEYLLKQFS